MFLNIIDRRKISLTTSIEFSERAQTYLRDYSYKISAESFAIWRRGRRETGRDFDRMRSSTYAAINLLHV